MRKCSKCLAEKPVTEFYPKRRKHARDGFSNICKPCSKAGALEWAAKNKERHNASTKKWVFLNKDSHAASVSKWAKANTHKRNHRYAMRRASKKNATPGWANHIAIGEYYAFAAIKSKLTAESWHVDHIVPLQSPVVCGLHTDYNLQVIRGSENISKHNRVWPDMP